MITDVAGVQVGHWSDPVGRTGCTVILFPEGTVASGEVRGGAPGTREWDLLAPERMVARIDAVVLAGGSAPGLAACDGVVRWCEERNLGFPTVGGPIPIVVGAVLYDRGVGDAKARPDTDAGYAACVAASGGAVATGAVGAGCGATINKWQGAELARPGGIGTISLEAGALVVGALIAVNAWGDLRPLTPVDPADLSAIEVGLAGRLVGDGATFSNTTIGVVATNAILDKSGCLVVAHGAHDGLARALEPVHSPADGDALVVAATGEVTAPVDVVQLLAARAVEAAVRAAVG